MRSTEVSCCSLLEYVAWSNPLELGVGGVNLSIANYLLIAQKRNFLRI